MTRKNKSPRPLERCEKHQVFSIRKLSVAAASMVIALFGYLVEWLPLPKMWAFNMLSCQV